MIDSIFVSSTAVHTYDFHMFIAIIHQYEGLFESNIFPVGLLAQLVERCTGIAEVMGSNPVRA